MKKKIIIILAGIVVLIVIICIIIGINSKIPDNNETATGNTTGNLYNNGLFCEADGYIYFSNPDDKNTLYKMDSECNNLEKLCTDKVSQINVCGDYIYYARFNFEKGVEVVFRSSLYGIYRIKTNGSRAYTIYNGIIGGIYMLGNNVYYQNYSEQNIFNFSKVSIRGNDNRIINQTGFLPACSLGKTMYFADIYDSHNLMKYDVDTEQVSTYKEGNYYLPNIYNGYIYYIDLDNNRALTRMKLSDESIEVIDSEDKVINYNIGNNEIFFQAENNETEHKFCRVNTNGSNKMTIADGDFCNINITSKYIFVYKISNSEEVLLRMPIDGTELSVYNPGKE